MRGSRRWSLLAFVGTWLLFASVAHGNFETTDAAFTMHAARSLWLRGDSALLTAEQGGELMGEQMGAKSILDAEAVGTRSNGAKGANGRAYVWFPMGHVYLMAPFVALGEQLRAALPDADERLQQRSREFPLTWAYGHPVVTQGLVSLLLPSLCMAASILLLYRIARVLGAGGRDAVIVALTVGFATQAFAVGREQLSDGPGLAAFLMALLQVVRLHVAATGEPHAEPGPGRGVAVAGRWTALWAGVWSGVAVLMRYQNAFVVVAFAVVVALSCRRRGSWRDLGLFVAGGLPVMALFLGTNYLRYGDPFDTGYVRLSAWFQASPLEGLTKILFAAGRGVAWFTPLVWLALPAAARGGARLRWLACTLFAIPLLLFMGANGWQAGQAWAIRYVTPGVVGLLAIVLPQAKPWRRWPKLWWGLVAAGLLVNLTSVVAPVRGRIQLMDQAVRATEAHAIAAGEMSPDERAADTADYGSWHPRYSPLWRNWTYALHACSGFEDERGRPRHDGRHGIALVYGVEPVDPVTQNFAPRHWTDRCFRHLWWRFWGDLYGVPGWLLVLPVALLGGVAFVLGWRRLSRDPSDSPTTADAG